MKINQIVEGTDGGNRLYKRHQELRKKSGLPDPDEYKRMMKTKQAEKDALDAEIESDKKKGVSEQYDPATAMMWIDQVSQLAQSVSQLNPEELVKLNDAFEGFYRAAGGAVAGAASVGIGAMFYELMKDTLYAAKRKARVDTDEILQLKRQIISIHKMLKRVKTEKAVAKYQAMLKQAFEVLGELEARHGNEVAEDSDPCWKNYKQVGMKKKGGRSVPNCVPNESLEEGNPTSDPWIAYDKTNPDKIKKFKTRDGAKKYADQHGCKVASFGFYVDHVKDKQGVTETTRRGFMKGAVGAAGLAVASKAKGVVLNPNRQIDAQGRSAANPYGNVDSMGNVIKKPVPIPPKQKDIPKTDKKDSMWDKVKGIFKEEGVSEGTGSSEFKEGDFVKDRTGKIYRVFAVNDTVLKVAPHRGEDSYGGMGTIHTTKVTRSEPPVEEGSMKAAANNPEGPKFGGYYGATQRGAPKPGQGFGAAESIGAKISTTGKNNVS